MSKKVENYMIDSDTKEGSCCPECNANWDGGDILQYYIDSKNDKDHKHHEYYVNKSDAELIEIAGYYGWTPETPRRFGHLIGVELSYDDPEHYDGVSYWQCPECFIAWNRFNGDRTEKLMTKMEKHKLNQKAMEEATDEEIIKATKVKRNE